MNVLIKKAIWSYLHNNAYVLGPNKFHKTMLIACFLIGQEICNKCHVI